MDIERIRELAVMISSLKEAAKELEEVWLNNADGCEYVETCDEDELDDYTMECTHPDLGCEPVCRYDNCPFLKQ